MKALEILMFDGQRDEPCIQKLDDHEHKKIVSIQKADVKLNETDDEKKNFLKFKNAYSPSPTGGRRSSML